MIDWHKAMLFSPAFRGWSEVFDNIVSRSCAVRKTLLSAIEDC
jgi:hypothetical protein